MLSFRCRFHQSFSFRQRSLPLTSHERRQSILDLMRRQPGLRVPELAQLLNVSEGTVRNRIKKLTDNLDIGVTFDVYGGWDIGPKVKLRYNKRWDPWGLFLEQQVFVRTDDGWGGRTTANVDYELPDKASFIRWVREKPAMAETCPTGRFVSDSNCLALCSRQFMISSRMVLPSASRNRGINLERR